MDKNVFELARRIRQHTTVLLIHERFVPRWSHYQRSPPELWADMLATFQTDLKVDDAETWDFYVTDLDGEEDVVQIGYFVNDVNEYGDVAIRFGDVDGDMDPIADGFSVSREALEQVTVIFETYGHEGLSEVFDSRFLFRIIALLRRAGHDL